MLFLTLPEPVHSSESNLTQPVPIPVLSLTEHAQSSVCDSIQPVPISVLSLTEPEQSTVEQLKSPSSSSKESKLFSSNGSQYTNGYAFQTKNGKINVSYWECNYHNVPHLGSR